MAEDQKQPPGEQQLPEPQPQEAPPLTFDKVHGPIVGECKATSVVIWYRDEVGVAKPPMLEYWPRDGGGDGDGEQRQYISIKVSKEADYTSKTKLTGLQPDTRYDYKINNGRQGSFQTPPASGSSNTSKSCSFVFGSCIGGQGYGRNPTTHPNGEGFAIFQAMLSLAPDFCQINGDSIYADNIIEKVSTQFWNKGQTYITQNDVPELPVTQSLEEFRGRYKYHLEDPVLANFLRNVPIYNTWDDHGT
jgi:alkaline phosphatase D